MVMDRAEEQGKHPGSLRIDMHRLRKRRICRNPALRRLAVLCLGCTASSALAQNWWLEAGPVVRGGMRVSVGGSSYAQQLGLHDPSAAGPLTAPGGIGSLASYGDRSYSNGYVKLDPGTGNRTPPNDPNSTWNWGFDQAAQYNPAAQTLTFQKQGPAGYTALADGSTGVQDDLLSAGLQLRGGVELIKSATWSLHVVLGLQGIWGAKSRTSETPYREEVRQIIITDKYDTSGIGAANFPAGGFHGTYLGPFDNPPVIPSPILPNLPQSRSTAQSALLSTSQANVSFEIRPDLYQFSLGPQAGCQVSSSIKLSLRPSVSLNLVDAEVSRDEVFTQTTAGGASTVMGRWSNHANSLNARFGLGVTAAADLDLGRGFYAGVFGGYEWMPDKVNLAVGPGTVSFDGSGYVAGAVIGKQF